MAPIERCTGHQCINNVKHVEI